MVRRRKGTSRPRNLPGKVVTVDNRELPIYNLDGELIFTGTVAEWREWVRERGY